jgi:phospholipase C
MPDPIQHVVVLMFENNSFDRMLGCMKAVYPTLDGVDPGVTRVNPDYPDTSHLFAQLPHAAFAIGHDPAHDLDDVLDQIDGGCMGFVRDFAQHVPQAAPADKYQIMAYFALDQLPVLHTLARNFLVCDHWFSSVPGPTWCNRFFVHSGTSLGHVDMPNGFFQPAIHLYNQPTVYQRLDERNVPWKIYFGDVPQSLLLTEQLARPFGYHHFDVFLQDATGPASAFPQYSFIEPHYFGSSENDQHPPTDVRQGEALLAQVYNALRANEELWRSTLLVVLYDEHGGFYDHVYPPPAVPPDGNVATFSFAQLGVRVPALLISPWVDAGVLPTQFDHTSLLKYATGKWALGPLGNRTPTANNFADALLKRTTPRPDCPAVVTAAGGAPNPMDVDLNAQQAALAGFTHHLESNITKPDEHTIAQRSVAMAGSFAQQSQTVADRVRDFLTKATGKLAG